MDCALESYHLPLLGSSHLTLTDRLPFLKRPIARDIFLTLNLLSQQVHGIKSVKRDPHTTGELAMVKILCVLDLLRSLVTRCSCDSTVVFFIPRQVCECGCTCSSYTLSVRVSEYHYSPSLSSKVHHSPAAEAAVTNSKQNLTRGQSLCHSHFISPYLSLSPA